MKNEFQSLADAIPDAVLVLDENHSIKWLNSAAQHLLGLKRPQDLGQSVTNLIRGPDFANWLAVVSKVSSNLEMPSPSNEDTWLSVSAVPYKDDQTILIFRDFSEMHKVEKIRRDFVANISHELRTPLTVLVGYLEMLEPAAETENEQAVVINRMSSQARQMQSLLDDLLELSRLQSEGDDPDTLAVDVPAILSTIREQAEDVSAGQHELLFSVKSSNRVIGSSKDIESAFRNLVVNALHYTPKGGLVTVVWQDCGQDTEFVVSDTGIGIPKRDLPRITERFYRVGSDRARETGGTGLGLAIVKHVLNSHHAKLDIESELGVGSTFRCVFPSKQLVREPIIIRHSKSETRGPV